jgi:hypothetical protein
MAALALALESELAPTAALQLSRALKICRRSPNCSPPQRAAAKMQVARLGWAFVTEARKAKGGTGISPNLRDALKAVQGCIAFATSGAPKVETATSVVDARQRDEETLSRQLAWAWNFCLFYTYIYRSSIGLRGIVTSTAFHNGAIRDLARGSRLQRGTIGNRSEASRWNFVETSAQLRSEWSRM